MRLGITRAKPDMTLAAQYSYLAIMAVPSGAAPTKRQLERLTRIESKLQPDQLAAAKAKATMTYNSWAKNGESPKAWELPTANDRDLDLICER